MHGIMAVFAATGAFLSFFHQGSLGGCPGYSSGGPSLPQRGSASGLDLLPLYLVGSGLRSCFTIFITRITEMATRKKLVKTTWSTCWPRSPGWMLLTYIIAKIIDTWYWAAVTAPAMGFTLMDFYSNNPGSA